MKTQTRRVVLGAVLGLALLPSAAFAAPVSVTVRIEGAKRTLLPATSVTVPSSGSVTGGGAPAGACPADTAAGAFARAVRGHFAAKYYPGTGLFVTSILGEKPTGSDYWDLFVNEQTSQTGICGVKLHRGERLLFADENGDLPALRLSGPTRGSVGHSVTLSLGYPFTDAKGHTTFKAAAGIEVDGARTNHSGHATIQLTRAGTLVLRALAPGYVRSQTLTIRVA